MGNGERVIRATEVVACLEGRRETFLDAVAPSGEAETAIRLFVRFLFEAVVDDFELAGDAPADTVVPRAVRKTEVLTYIRKTYPTLKGDPFEGIRGIGDQFEKLPGWSHYCPEIGTRIVVRPAAPMRREGKREYRVYWLRVAIESPNAEDRVSRPAVVAPMQPFKGRKAELARASAALQRGQVVTLVGAPGIGKTELARVIAATTPGFDDVIEHNMWGGRAELEPVHVLTDLLTRLETRRRTAPRRTKGTLAGLRNAYLDTLAESPTLIFLDDVRPGWPLEHLLPPPGSALLITTQYEPNIPGAEVIALPLFDHFEAKEFLVERVPRAAAPLSEDLRERLVRGEGGPHVAVRRRSDLADAVVELCGRLPLAVDIAVATLRAYEDLPVHAYVERLMDQSSRLRALDQRKGETNRLEVTLSTSYELLAPDTQRFFRQLAVFPFDFRPRASDVVCEDSGGEHLRELRRRHLADMYRDHRRYFLHDLVRSFANARMSPDERNETERRFAEYFTSYVQRVSWEGDRSAIDADVRSLTRGPLYEDNENFAHALEWSHARAGDPFADRVCATLGTQVTQVLRREGSTVADPRELDWSRRAVNAAYRLRDTLLVIGNIFSLLLLEVEQRCFDDALATAVLGLRIASQTQARDMRISFSEYVARLTYRRGALTAAEGVCKLAMPLAKKEDSSRFPHLAIVAASVALDQERTNQAVRICTRALRHIRRMKAAYLEPYVLNVLGDAYFAGRNFEKAQAVYERVYALRFAPVNWFANFYIDRLPVDLPAAERNDFPFHADLVTRTQLLFNAEDLSQARENDEGPFAPELHALIRLARIEARIGLRETAEANLRCALMRVAATGNARTGLWLEVATVFNELGLSFDALGSLHLMSMGDPPPRVRSTGHFLRARILANLGFVTTAIDAMTKALESCPSEDWPLHGAAKRELARLKRRPRRTIESEPMSVGVCTREHDHDRPVSDRVLKQVLREYQPRNDSSVPTFGGRITFNLPNGFGGPQRRERDTSSAKTSAAEEAGSDGGDL